jgi:hypothetical protein
MRRPSSRRETRPGQAPGGAGGSSGAPEFKTHNRQGKRRGEAARRPPHAARVPPECHLGRAFEHLGVHFIAVLVVRVRRCQGQPRGEFLGFGGIEPGPGPHQLGDHGGARLAAQSPAVAVERLVDTRKPTKNQTPRKVGEEPNAQFPARSPPQSVRSPASPTPHPSPWLTPTPAYLLVQGRGVCVLAAAIRTARRAQEQRSRPRPTRATRARQCRRHRPATNRTRGNEEPIGHVAAHRATPGLRCEKSPS